MIRDLKYFLLLFRGSTSIVEYVRLQEARESPGVVQAVMRRWASLLAVLQPNQWHVAPFGVAIDLDNQGINSIHCFR